MKRLFLIIIIALLHFSSLTTFAYLQRCTLISQTRSGPGSDSLICDYQCEDGTSRTRYMNAPYCPAEMGSGGY